MIVTNAPGTLKQRIQPALNILAEKRGINDQGFARAEQLVDE